MMNRSGRLGALRDVVPARRRPGRDRLRSFRRAGGFTLVELLVVIAILVVLLSILMPSLRSAKQIALRAKCAMRLRTIGLAIHAYAGENRDWLPFSMHAYGVQLMGVGDGKYGGSFPGGPSRFGLLYAKTLKPGGNINTFVDYHGDAGYIADPKVLYCPGRTYKLQPIPGSPWTPMWSTWMECNYAGYSHCVPNSGFWHNTNGYRAYRRDVEFPGWPWPSDQPYVTWAACFRADGPNPTESPHANVGVNALYRDDSVRFVARPDKGWGGQSWNPGYECGNIVDGMPSWRTLGEAYSP